MEVSNAIADAWHAIEISLIPIMGSQGVAALYKRSLLLTGRMHPWLVEIREDKLEHTDLSALKLVLARQDSNTAAEAGGELLQTFYALVRSLIGASLTRRLLQDLWEAFQ